MAEDGYITHIYYAWRPNDFVSPEECYMSSSGKKQKQKEAYQAVFKKCFLFLTKVKDKAADKSLMSHVNSVVLWRDKYCQYWTP